MGLDPVTVGLITAGISGGVSVVGGIQTRNEAEAQASATRTEAQRQANLRRQEAENEARREVRANIALEKRQKLSFIKSGVALEGSPLLLLAETGRKGTENIEAILQSGRTGATGLLAQGQLQSSALRSTGRQALVGGLTRGATTAVGGFRDFRTT